MALSQSTLKNNFISWMQGAEDYTTIQDSMEEFCNAYEDYAMNAEDITTDPPLVVFKSAMLAILNTLETTGTAEIAAQKFEDATIAFWEGASFDLSVPPSGCSSEVSALVTTNIVPGALKAALLSIFTNFDDNTTYESSADSLATAFHNATTTIIVTCIGVNSSPPPTNLTELGPIS